MEKHCEPKTKLLQLFSIIIALPESKAPRLRDTRCRAHVQIAALEREQKKTNDNCDTCNRAAQVRGAVVRLWTKRDEKEKKCSHFHEKATRSMPLSSGLSADRSIARSHFLLNDVSSGFVLGKRMSSAYGELRGGATERCQRPAHAAAKATAHAHMYNKLEIANPARQPFTKSPLDIC